MRFEDVLPALREGKKIRGKRFGDLLTNTVFSRVEYKFGDAFTAGSTLANYAISEFLADDWEIVEEKPLPCPFCGGKAIWATAEKDIKVYVYCPDCHATGPKIFDNSDKAVSLWNKAKR